MFVYRGVARLLGSIGTGTGYCQPHPVASRIIPSSPTPCEQSVSCSLGKDADRRTGVPGAVRPVARARGGGRVLPPPHRLRPILVRDRAQRTGREIRRGERGPAPGHGVRRLFGAGGAGRACCCSSTSPTVQSDSARLGAGNCMRSSARCWAGAASAAAKGRPSGMVLGAMVLPVLENLVNFRGEERRDPGRDRADAAVRHDRRRADPPPVARAPLGGS